jgi:hypothetical protein
LKKKIIEDGNFMRKLEDECVGCKDLGLPCFGDSCPNRNVTRFYCDRCNFEEQLYYFDGQELCLDCIESILDKVVN